MIFRVKVISFPNYINIGFIKSHYNRDFDVGTIHNVEQSDILKIENDLVTFNFFYFNGENDDNIEVKGFVGKIINRVKQMKEAHGEILISYYEIKNNYVSLYKKHGIIENFQNFQKELHQHISIDNNKIILNNINIIKAILINLNIFSTILLINDAEHVKSTCDSAFISPFARTVSSKSYSSLSNFFTVTVSIFSYSTSSSYSLTG